MASSNLDAVIGRALRDPEFRTRMTSDAAGIAREYKLSKEEQITLENINKTQADQFFSKVAGGRMQQWCTAKTCYESG